MRYVIVSVLLTALFEPLWYLIYLRGGATWFWRGLQQLSYYILDCSFFLSLQFCQKVIISKTCGDVSLRHSRIVKLGFSELDQWWLIHLSLGCLVLSSLTLFGHHSCINYLRTRLDTATPPYKLLFSRALLLLCHQRLIIVDRTVTILFFVHSKLQTTFF